MAVRTSCGVLVTDGATLLLGHATRTTRWDIPKGLADPGEAFGAAAVRELREETGLVTTVESLVELGVHAYMPGKALALFGWVVGTMPETSALVCTSLVVVPGRAGFPEMDRFGVFGWDEALGKVGKTMARVLGGLDRAALGRHRAAGAA